MDPIIPETAAIGAANATNIVLIMTTVASVFANIGLIIYNLFSKTEKAKDAASTELVALLQTTVNTLKTQLDDLQKSHIENVKETSRLRGENETLTKILQGRDEATIKFQQQGLVAFETIAKSTLFFEKLAGTLDRIDEHLSA
jgi:regulator of replication initiation timing